MKYFLLLLFFLCNTAFSYPFFYKCGENGRFEESLTPAEISDALIKLSQSTNGNIDELVTQLCDGKKTCIEDFKNLIELGKNSKDSLKVNLNNLIQQQKKTSVDVLDIESFITEVDDMTYNQAKLLNQISQDIQMCSDAKKNLNPDNFIHDENAIVYYPYHTNYMYMNGCFKNSSEKCELKMNVDNIKESIDRSLIIGADPYVTIAINMMEGFNRDYNTGLTWDQYIDESFWLTRAMKCPRKIPAKGVVVENKFFNKRLPKFLKHKVGYDYNKASDTNRSYMCRKHGYDGNAFMSPDPNPHACCMKLDLVYDESLYNKKDIVSAMMFEYIRQKTYPNLEGYYKNRGADSRDPASLIQRYNGYSSAMGGGEPVNAWRAGVSHYKDPVYGFQVMDYLINSLMTNPLINSLVEKKKKEHGNPRSLLCANKKPGNYVIDSDYYKNRNRDGKRMANIEKYKDTPWNEWPDNYKRVMIQELGDKKVSPEVLKNFTFGTIQESRLVKDIKNIDYSSISKLARDVENIEYDSQDTPQLMNRMVNHYFSQVYPKRQTRGETSGYSWKRLTPNQIISIGQKLGTK